MHFTHDSYINLLQLLKKNDYHDSDYTNWMQFEKSVILRHDIDFSIEKSLTLAEIENKYGVKSTYFVLLTTDFYNVFSKKNINLISSIIKMGHEIGLHFDETVYDSNDTIEDKIVRECEILSEAIGYPVKVVSMHRPSKDILNRNISIPGIINSYSDIYFRNFKYLSDSRRNWKENVEEIIKSDKYNRLHILTHAFWYNEKELSIYESVSNFIDDANNDRYSSMSDNITDLESILNR